MSLLADVQAALLEEGKSISLILLRFKLLASRLGSGALEQWVKHELEGYPPDAELPDYRLLGVSYIADFTGPFGSGMTNAPIPTYLIEKYAGKRWTNIELRQSISGIDALIGESGEGSLQIEASNLILILQGKIYEGYGCVGVRGRLSKAQLVEIQHAVRSRMLDLTIQLENTVPESRAVSASIETQLRDMRSSATVNNITNNIIHGHYTSVTTAGNENVVSVSVGQGSKPDVIKALEAGGVSKNDAAAFAELLESETPEPGQGFGKRTKAWIAENLKKAVDGTWTSSISTVGKLLEQAAFRYYGLEVPGQTS